MSLDAFRVGVLGASDLLEVPIIHVKRADRALLRRKLQPSSKFGIYGVAPWYWCPPPMSTGAKCLSKA